jgi:hypothetical protein
MTGDFTRTTFRSANRYSKVRAQQGRAVLDAELNEQADIAAYGARITSTDVIGQTGAPYHEPSVFKNFQVKVDASGKDLLIAPGRLYVDGILCENDADGLTLLKQPDLPGAALPSANGSYAVYVDVWERHIAPAEQSGGTFPPMREAALGGADTASRVRVVWQVKLAAVASHACSAFTPPPAPTGKLRASEVKGTPAANDCLVPTSGGYRGLENQLYRVEVHASSGGTATFKWSRDNASLSSAAKSSDQTAGVIEVKDPGRDDATGFVSAKFVELSDETRTLNGLAGLLLEVDTVTGTSIKVKNPSNASLALGPNAIVRRWDGIGTIAANAPIELESGVQVEFDGGSFGVGDHWSFPARTLTGKVEWPRNASGDPVFELRHGTIHHYAPLAVVSLTGGTFAAAVQDCRKLFPPLTAIKASDVSYNPAQCANLQGTTTVQQALDKLCQSTGGAEPGIHVKGVFIASGEPLVNDTFLQPGDVLKGIRVDCDQRLFEGSVVNKHGLPNPVCTVTVSLPWPLEPTSRQFWAVDAGAVIGYQPIVLGGEVVVRENTIVWTPLAPAQKWLNDRLLQMVTEMTNDPNPRVLVRLRLTGNFVWGPERDPKLYLDGDGFGAPAADHVDVSLPTGDGRRGGNFEMWFWFVRPQTRTPGIGFVPNRASRFFAAAANPPSVGVQATQLGIDRSSSDLRAVLPAGYTLDASQRFSDREAAVLARQTGVQGLTSLTSERFARVGTLLVAQLTRSLRISVTSEVMADAPLLERVRAGMATGAAPDFVVGDDTLAEQLKRLGYGDDLIRL